VHPYKKIMLRPPTSALHNTGVLGLQVPTKQRLDTNVFEGVITSLLDGPMMMQEMDTLDINVIGGLPLGSTPL
jgi:hypothetical protein